MKLKPLGSNMVELDLESDGFVQTKVLFSYQTPVAYSQVGPEGTRRYKTSTKYSQTTTRHINKWYHDYDGEIEQEKIDNLVK